jgi:thioredoxin reductase (NADPH)
LSIEQYEVVVVGAGPAGLSAGIFVARQRAKCMLISKDLGGQLNLIPKLENYPGTIMSSGPLLAKTLENQYLTFGGEMTFDTVEKVEEMEGSTDLRIKTVRSEYITKALVLAPGKVPNNLGVENEVQFQNKGVHYCTKCDAPFYQGRITATVGVGGYLLESGILLSRMASKVYLIYRGGQLGGDKDMIESLKRKNNVELVPNSSVSFVKGGNALQQIQIKDNSGSEKTIDVDGLFIEMGSKINLDFVKHLIKINTKGEIEVTEGGKTTHPAIFAAGDATNIPYKQIVAACGDGAAAGLSAFNYIEKLKGKPGIRSDWKKTIGDTVYHY